MAEDDVVFVDTPGAVRAVAAGSPRITMRNYLSTHHLYAARYAADDAETIEAAYDATRSAFDLRHRAHVLSAITEAVSFVEAAINELFQDAADGHVSYVDSLGSQALSIMKELWTGTNEGRLRALEKYNLALLASGHNRFESGEAPYQAADMLVRLRNHIVHYRPYEAAADDLIKLGKQLQSFNWFRDNRLMTGSGNPWFPDHALGAGCAEWAWRTARAMTDEFSARTGLRFNYQQADFGDPLPV
jgi:hypothetical protein